MTPETTAKANEHQAINNKKKKSNNTNFKSNIKIVQDCKLHFFTKAQEQSSRGFLH